MHGNHRPQALPLAPSSTTLKPLPPTPKRFTGHRGLGAAGGPQEDDVAEGDGGVGPVRRHRGSLQEKQGHLRKGLCQVLSPAPLAPPLLPTGT